MVLQFFVDGHTAHTQQGKKKKPNHAHMKIEIKENATRTNTN
jgi:hypothetical protein